jgi:hypothetical protein
MNLYPIVNKFEILRRILSKNQRNMKIRGNKFRLMYKPKIYFNEESLHRVKETRDEIILKKKELIYPDKRSSI